jgi:uncharacterized membrane-anchored protein YhcB (DUF1043 family)
MGFGSVSFHWGKSAWNFCNLRANEVCGYSGSVQVCIQSYRIMKSLARAYVLLAAHPALAAVLSSASGFAVFICIRLLETKEKRTERRQRKQQRELKALTERISAYARNMHNRFPRGEFVVGEKDLAERLRKHPDSVANALNVLLGQRKVQKAPLSGYWKLNT